MVPSLRPALLLLLQAFLLWDTPVAASIQEQYCESLPPITNHTGPQCNASVDLIGTCWPRSAVGQLVARPCPEYFYGVRYNTTNNGYRECLANGSWAARVNYSQCQEILSEERRSKLHYHIAIIINYLGHCVSLGALLVAFVLFMRLRSIRCLRNIIHWNLITAFILRNATWFVVQLTMNPEVHESNVVWCRLVTAAYNYFHVTNFFWMFGEGCYLHTAIVLTYSTDKLRKWMFICIGWCIPFPIIIAWAIGKLYYDDEKCWFGKRAGVYTDYIYQGPMILVLLINFIFLFNIVRILMTKLRASTTSETIQYRKAVKATLVLLPLLGITYMLFFVNPGEDEISRIVFIYFNSFLESFQGFFVSVFYCFLNSEPQVHLQPQILPRQEWLLSIPSSGGGRSTPEKICSQGAIGRTEALAPLAGQALHPCPRGEGHVHPHLPDPRQLPQHQAIHGCLSRERAAAPGADVPAVGDPWEGGTAQSQVLPVAPAPQGEHELSRSWDTCTAPAARAGQAWRTGQLRRCFVTSLAAV
ncbi:corticotropin-releasing factor receptor 1 isoform X2 [Aphelocoma coerulescens]|uniref:corticotropin-releasing factor receptor 1 isoform X2 n=1 Tax=Aphelocoma coerulescens TaxID=39617 RepID=UPI0036052341